MTETTKTAEVKRDITQLSPITRRALLYLVMESILDREIGMDTFPGRNNQAVPIADQNIKNGMRFQ